MMEKKRPLTLENAQNLFSRIPKHLILAFIAACVFFMIVHAGYFDDRFVNEDYRHTITFNSQKLAMGRFLHFHLITYYCNSWLTGCISCIYMGLAAALIVDLFQIRNKIGIVVAAALMVGMPSLSYMYSYLYSCIFYSQGQFMAILAVWIACRWRRGFIPAIIIYAASIAVVQCVLISGPVLCILVLLRSVITEKNFSYKTWLKLLLKLFVMGVLGVLLYLLVWRLLLRINNVEAMDYKGLNQIGQLSIRQIAKACIQSYKDFYGFFFGTRFFFTSKMQKIAYLVMFLTGLLALVFVAVKETIRIPGIVIALLALPLGVGIIQILVPQTRTDNLMVYPIVYFIIMLIVMAEGYMPENKLGTLSAWLLMLSLCATVLCNLDITSAYYVKAETYQEQTMAYENRLLSRIEETPGYYPGIPIAIISDRSSEYVGLRESDFPHVLNDRGMWYSYTGTKANANKNRVQEKTINLIEMYTGVTLKPATDAQVQRVRDSSQYAELTPYPLDRSICVIDGILTVNAVYYEVEVMQADDNTVLLNYVSRVPDDQGGTYAWYVYRDGERVSELERGYREVPEHLVTLTEDGAYSFKCYCKNNGVSKSVISASVEVKNGVIAADAGLKQISMEEAMERALPPVQVSVESTGEMAISLKMVDNSYRPGPEATYAWHIYKNGERLREYDRDFTSDPSYDLLLKEEGAYRFELVCRSGENGTELSVLSEEITVTRELEILQAGDREILLSYVGPAAEKSGISYAWYVYRDGEKIEELSRGYQREPDYLLTLDQNGSYTFKCFYRIGEEKKSVMSDPVVVENGAIVDASRMEQISLEDALKRITPAVEVQVMLVGERGVRLTMIDNTLNAGPEYSYAWYVYRDGERVKKYDRKYTSSPEYEINLAEDGEYQFKLFYRVGDDDSYSVMSEKITIGNAQSAAA